MTRPGKEVEDGSSGTVGFIAKGVFKCWTDKSEHFKPETKHSSGVYSPSAVLAIVDFNSDFTAMNRHLYSQGYGEQKTDNMNNEKTQDKVKFFNPATDAEEEPPREEAKKPDSKEKEEKKEAPTAADILMKTATQNTTFFRDDSKISYAEISENGKNRILYLKSEEYSERLLYTHFKKTGRVLSARGVVDAVVSTLSASTIDKPTRKVFLRKAYHENNLYYDMGDDSGRVIEITKNGYKIIEKSPVAFIRAEETIAQVEPKTGGDIQDLKKLINVKDEDFILAVAWMMSFFQPQGTQPILHIKSAEGTAKTTTTKNIRVILDPYNSPSLEAPETKADFNLGAMNNSVLTYENLSFIPQWLSDSLCCLSTGQASNTRKFHTQMQQAKFKAQRPVILNSITDVATKPDLLSRIIKLELPKIKGFKDEMEMEKEFEEFAPSIFHLLLEAAVEGLKNLETVDLGAIDDRTAMFMKWVCACSPKLGFTQKEFLDAYKANRNRSKGVSIEMSSLASELESWARAQEGVKHQNGKLQIFRGTTRSLVRLLETHAGYGYSSYESRPPKDWPDTPQSAGRQLLLLNSTLFARGLEITEAKKSSGELKFNIFKLETGDEGLKFNVFMSEEAESEEDKNFEKKEEHDFNELD